MTHRDSLLRAIAHAPGEDTLRLAYADWLEENGDQQHAEFVRVQVALSKPFDASMCELVSAVWCPTCGDCTCPNREDRMDDDSCPLHSPYSRHAGSSWLEKRERKLLRLVEPVVRRGTKCGRCKEYRYPGKVPDDHNLRNPTWLDCPHCHGGYTGTLARKWDTVAADYAGDPNTWVTRSDWHHHCDWSRGFPHRVYCTLAEYQQVIPRVCPCCENKMGMTCDKCDNADYSVTWAEALLREHGTITEVVLTDREPERDRSALAAGFSYDWLNGDVLRRNDAATLPGYLFEVTRLQNSSHNPPGFNFAEWLTEAAALAALARAAADHARQLAGLPRVWGDLIVINSIQGSPYL